MPKTKNAFAFKDFDETRILSRNFFDKFLFDGERITEKGLSDVDAIKKFLPKNSDVQSLEIYIEKLKILKKSLNKYFLILYRQHLRLLNIAEILDKKQLALTDDILNGMTDELKNKANDLKFRRQRVKTSILHIAAILENLNTTQNFVDNEIDSTDKLIYQRYRENFAGNLKELRKKAGLTQRKMSELTGITQSDLALFEKARKTPSFISLCKILRLEGFSANNLLTN